MSREDRMNQKRRRKIEKNQKKYYSSRHKKTSWLKKVGIALLTLIGLLAVAGCAAFFYLQFGVLGKTNYVQSDHYTIAESIEPVTYVNEQGEIETETEAVLEEDIEEDLIAKQEEALARIRAKGESEKQTEETKQTTKKELKKEKSIYNLLLIGVDRRDSSWNGNSDVMLLATVNDYTQKVYLTSFMRDLYANIPEVGVRKLNAACAYGGPQLCVETIKSNYGVEINDWAMVDFYEMADIIDEIGGVDLELSPAEVDYVNTYVDEIDNQSMSGWLSYTESGIVHLNGDQAVTHARNRSVGYDSDFGRTQRQRDVLNAMIKQLVSQDIKTITSTIWKLLPNVTHSLSNMEILSLMTRLPAWIEYDVEQLRLPFDGEWYSENEILIPNDIGVTVDTLLSTIYAK